MKTWRRLQQLGAVAIRNAVYVLPDSSQAREDFEWMKEEILANKGEASVFAADTIDRLTGDDIVAAFRKDRERTFKEIQADAKRLKGVLSKADATRGTNRRRLQRAVRQLRDRFAQVAATDLFDARGREETNDVISELEQVLAGPPPAITEAVNDGDLLPLDEYRHRTWLTRPRPGIDRSGSAWLIRRFIDPTARFAFADTVPPSSKVVPFDMYDVGFSHQGDRCTFEVLCLRFGIKERAVARLGCLVHDLDLKESRYNVPEAAAIGRLIDGLRQTYSKDDELLEHGIVVFEAMYRAFSGETDSAGATSHGRRRGRRRKKGT
ncbi:MAG: chromate resistance protein ChrB domain-containing protein [Bacteroidales bacterium]